VIVASVVEIVLLGEMAVSVDPAAVATADPVPRAAVVSAALVPGVIVPGAIADRARGVIVDPGRRAALAALRASPGIPRAVPVATVRAVGPAGPTSVPSR